MSYKPRCCDECPYTYTCPGSMYSNSCLYWPPESRPLRFRDVIEKIKNKFKKK